MSNIKLIVGLGNPGPKYESTRHNAGAWFVEKVAEHCFLDLKLEKKFFGQHQKVSLGSSICHLLIPTTYMNDSGKAIAAICNYYDISPQEVLVAHDELDLAPGRLKIKLDGGHGGHNGLRDIIKALNTNQFYRLRLGIGHPGHKDQVHDFVLSNPGKKDKTLIDEAIDKTLHQLDEIVTGNINKAVQALHTD